MIPKRKPSAREQQILKGWVTPTLEQAGFKQQGNVYTRVLGRVHHLLDIQESRHKTAGNIEFTMNCGIFVPGVWTAWACMPENKEAAERPRVIDVRPGLLMAPWRDRWWEIKVTDGPERDAEIGQELRSVVEEGALPFFDRFPNERALAEFLSKPRTKETRAMFSYGEGYQMAFAAILWDLLGSREMCQQCLEQAVALSRKTPGKDIVDAFLKRFSCGNHRTAEDS